MTGSRRVPEECKEACPELSDVELRLLSSLPGYVSVHLQNGQILWANSELSSAFTSSEPKALVDRYFDSMNPQDRVVALNAISEAVEHTQERRIEFKRQCKNGDAETFVHTYEMQVSPYVRQTSGDKPLALVITRETTCENATVTELKKQLRSAEIERVERNRFFSSMSHELRTPLNAIIGFSELLEGKAAIKLGDEKKLEYASVINESANHLLSLINDILDLSKLEEGKQVQAVEELSLRELLQTTVRTMMPAALDKQIDLILDCDEELPPVHSDSRVLRQVFTNLVSNAVKFSGEGKEVRLKVTRLRNRYKISVIDNGIGMDSETLSKLGGVFYQSGDVIKGDYEGSGLGMSIVFKLVELIGGKIAVNSKPGIGTTVSVILPVGGPIASPVPGKSSEDVVYLHKKAAEQPLGSDNRNNKKGVL